MLDEDRHFMSQALALGATAEGSTSPNPRVGCLLVHDGEVVGRGCHRVAGGSHAEAQALAEAGERASGATAYVNLEPCAHHGKTPPCTDLLLRAGVRRVVAAALDPDPRVDGRGFSQLREHGVELEVGLLAEEAERLNAPFLRWHRHRLPLVTLKAAGSLDGMLSAREGESRWITGEVARCFAQRLRLRHDAILVGAGTVRADDPRLTVRVGAGARRPLRVVLSASLELDPNARVFDDAAPTRIYTGAPPKQSGALAERVEIRPVGGGATVDLEAVLRDLAAEGLQSVLVEGGGRTLGAFVSAGLADRFALFSSGRLLGARGATPMLDTAAPSRPAAARRVIREHVVALGRDLLVMGRIVGPGAG